MEKGDPAKLIPIGDIKELPHGDRIFLHEQGVSLGYFESVTDSFVVRGA